MARTSISKPLHKKVVVVFMTVLMIMTYDHEAHTTVSIRTVETLDDLPLWRHLQDVV